MVEFQSLQTFVLAGGAVCCSMVQCGAVWCSVLQCVAVPCLLEIHDFDSREGFLQCFESLLRENGASFTRGGNSSLQLMSGVRCVTVSCSVLQYVAVKLKGRLFAAMACIEMVEWCAV